jgi:hypothetical protein
MKSCCAYYLALLYFVLISFFVHLGGEPVVLYHRQHVVPANPPPLLLKGSDGETEI